MLISRRRRPLPQRPGVDLDSSSSFSVFMPSVIHRLMRTIRCSDLEPAAQRFVSELTRITLSHAGAAKEVALASSATTCGFMVWTQRAFYNFLVLF